MPAVGSLLVLVMLIIDTKSSPEYQIKNWFQAVI